MKGWSNNLKIGAGVATVAVLAGVGVLVWALGFRGESKSAKQPSLLRRTPATQSFSYPIPSGPNARNTGLANESGVAPLNTAPLVAAASVLSAGDVLKAQASRTKLNFPLAGANRTTGFSEGGVRQLPTAPLTSASAVLSAGDTLAPQAGTQKFSYSLPTGNRISGFSEGGVSQLPTAPLSAAAGLLSAGDSLVPETTPQMFRFSIPSGNATRFGGGGLEMFNTASVEETAPVFSAGDVLSSSASFESQMLNTQGAGANVATPSLLRRPLTPLTSVAAADLLFTDASLAPAESFSYSLPSANTAVPGIGGVLQYKTAPIVKTASVTSAADLLFSQASFSGEKFKPQSGQTAPNTVNPRIKLPSSATSLGSRARHLSNAKAGGFGIVFCGNVVNGRCSPVFRTSAPHTTSQLKVGFVWQGLPVGTKVSLIFVDINARKVVARPTPPYSLPAGQGGVILVTFRGPLPVLKLGVGILLNGKLQRGVYVLNIV